MFLPSVGSNFVPMGTKTGGLVNWFTNLGTMLGSRGCTLRLVDPVGIVIQFFTCLCAWRLGWLGAETALVVCDNMIGEASTAANTSSPRFFTTRKRYRVFFIGCSFRGGLA